MDSALIHFPPMGVYETLFKFLDATGKYMGTEGTHPWAQGFPLTTPIPGGPDIPTSISFTHTDLKYPPATGGKELLEAIRDYYNHFYGSSITTDNVAIFAGGRPGIYTTLAFLKPEFRVLIEETEYTPYWDALKLLGRDHAIIPSNPYNRFRPSLSDYQGFAAPSFVVKSNPCNPTGVTWRGETLKQLVDFCKEEGRGGLFDEAYEFFQTGEPDSAMRYVGDIDKTNLFVVSAATKGLQAPGLRVGWVVASKQNIELFRNFSSIAMGGVARPSQICTAGLLQLQRAKQAREAIGAFYGSQRARYGEALTELGFELFTGDGGFYHWGRLPGGLTADEFNERLFKHEAAILPGTLCDMFRRGSASPLASFVRFSFGPLKQESFDSDVAILRAALG
ncbi:MAG: pyridoxal phosphate-dependent aminotransferase [Armatimonadetes bacterium]|nr:pyridoxal phosphate-dependent aminotransferase [Armatimonadota bacterium]